MNASQLVDEKLEKASLLVDDLNQALQIQK